MLNKTNFPLLQWGELYFYFEDNNVFSKYTLNPFATNFSEPISSENFNDLINFLNMDESTLIKDSHQLLNNILYNRPYKITLYRVMTELASVHNIFKRGTALFICDFLIQYSLHTLLRYAYIESDEELGKKLLIVRIKKICSAILHNNINVPSFATIQAFTEYYLNVYNTLIFSQHNCLGKLPSIYNDIFYFRDFIVNNMPEKVPSFAQIDWQKFMIFLNKQSINF